MGSRNSKALKYLKLGALQGLGIWGRTKSLAKIAMSDVGMQIQKIGASGGAAQAAGRPVVAFFDRCRLVGLDLIRSMTRDTESLKC